MMQALEDDSSVYELPLLAIVGSPAVCRQVERALAGAPFRLGAGDPAVVVVITSGNDTDSVRHARAKCPFVPVVVVTDSVSPAEARRLLVDGVAGVVLEADLGRALVPTLEAVLAGQVSYPAESMPARVRETLSKREKQILGMVVLGFSNAEIAAKLYVSQSTVKSHLSSAFATLGVRSRKEAVALILDPDAGYGTGILAITEAT
jgi:DNA-binding NarL/FixJ family response regulator